MIRLLAVAVLSLIGNAIAIVVAGAVLDDMLVEPVGLVVAVVIFTIASVLFEPLIRQMALKSAPALLGSSALVSTLVALIATTLLTGDDFQIRGGITWVLATVIVWAVSLAARLFLPLVIFKKTLAEHRGNRV